LDTLAETRLLTNGEWEQLENASDILIKLLREEELKFYQRAKATDVLLGDNNTRYFEMVVNGKHRKKRIFRWITMEPRLRAKIISKNVLLNFIKIYLVLLRIIISFSRIVE